MTTSTGSASVLIGQVTSVVPTPADSYQAAAQHFLVAARVLVSAPGCALAFNHLCGHVTECLFKAFLSGQGVSEKAVRDHQHDLRALRAHALTKGLPIDPAEPQWLVTLSSQHGQPYTNRYLREGPRAQTVGLHGLVMADPRVMLSGLDALELVVRSAMPSP